MLLGDEAHAIDDRVDLVATGRYGPDELAYWCLEVASQVPQLHALAHSASTSHDQVTIVADVDAVAGDARLATDRG